MSITYRQLLKRIQNLPNERLDDDISILDHNEDEVHHIKSIGITSACQPTSGILDDGCLFLILDK